MGDIYISSNYLIYVLTSNFDIYQDNRTLLTNFGRNSLMMKTLLPNEYQPTCCCCNFVIPKAKAGNKQCASSVPFVLADLKLNGILQSITDEIYNKAKGIVQDGSVLKGFGNLSTYKTLISF